MHCHLQIGPGSLLTLAHQHATASLQPSRRSRRAASRCGRSTSTATTMSAPTSSCACWPGMSNGTCAAAWRRCCSRTTTARRRGPGAPRRSKRPRSPTAPGRRLGGHGKRTLAAVLEYWLNSVSPGAHLQLEAIDDADALLARFSFDRPGDVETRPYRATNVGFGLSHTSPALVALLSDPGTLCLIGNPEAHLHPRGQARLAELAVHASRAGIQDSSVAASTSLQSSSGLTG